MIRYLPSACKRCDWGRREPDRWCREGRCNTYEPQYITIDMDKLEEKFRTIEIGFASLEEFNAYYGTHWEE